MMKKLILSTPMVVMIFLAYIEAQNGNEALNGTFTANITELELTCTINNVTYYGNECLEPLGKFAKVVGWIVTGFLLIVIACCCGCWCCICKIIHSNKNRPMGGQVLSRNHQAFVTTVS